MPMEIGERLTRIGAGLNAFSGSPSAQARGERLRSQFTNLDRETADRERQAEAKAQEFTRQLLLGERERLGAELARPDLAPEQRARFEDGFRRISERFGLESLEAPAAGTSPSLVSGGELPAGLPEGTVLQRAPDGTLSTLHKPSAAVNKNVVLNPLAQLRGPDGKLIAENTNRRKTGGSRRAGQLSESRARQTEIAQRTIEKAGGSKKLSDQLAASKAQINQRVIDGVTTKSNGDKQKAALSKSGQMVLKIDRVYDKAEKLLKKNGAVGTSAGDAARAIENLSANVRGLWSLIPGQDSTDVDLGESAYADKLEQYAGDNAELRTALFNGAIAMATADGLLKGRVSNQRIEQALDQLGANARSPQAILTRVLSARNRMIEGFQTQMNFALDNFTELDEIGDEQNRTEFQQQSDEDLLNF